MPRIQPVNREELDAGSLSLLQEISGEGQWNVFDGIAHHPPTLRAMDALRQCVDSGLELVEQEVIAIEIARHNGCGYCLPAHRYVCHQAGVDAGDIEALTRGELLQHRPELMHLQQFVRAALTKKGNLDDAELAEFQSLGFDTQKMIVILAEIALYTLLNYFNRLARSDIESVVEPFISTDADWITAPDR